MEGSGPADRCSEGTPARATKRQLDRRYNRTRCSRFAFIRGALLGQRIAAGPGQLAASAADDEPLDSLSCAGSLDE